RPDAASVALPGMPCTIGRPIAMHDVVLGALCAADAAPDATQATRTAEAVRRAAVVFMPGKESKGTATLPIPLPLDGVLGPKPRPAAARPRGALAAVRAAHDDAVNMLRRRRGPQERALAEPAMFEAHDRVAAAFERRSDGPTAPAAAQDSPRGERQN